MSKKTKTIDVEKPMIIDVDVVIEKYNKENPDKKQLTQSDLAKQIGVNSQVFSDWKRGDKTPKLIERLLKLKDVGKLKSIEEIIKNI